MRESSRFFLAHPKVRKEKSLPTQKGGNIGRKDAYSLAGTGPKIIFNKGFSIIKVHQVSNLNRRETRLITGIVGGWFFNLGDAQKLYLTDILVCARICVDILTMEFFDDGEEII